MDPYYQRNGVELYLGEALDLLAHVRRAGIGGIITDPPYSSGGTFRVDRSGRGATRKYLKGDYSDLPDFAGDSRDQRTFLLWCQLWMHYAREACEPQAPMLVFCDWRQLPTITDAVQVGGWTWSGVWPWHKRVGRSHANRPMSSVEYVVYGVSGQVRQDADAAYLPGMLEFPSVPPKQRMHPVEKPTSLLRALMKLVRPGGSVLDPFAGSGSTLAAALETGRPAIGFEVDESIAEIAAKRLEQTTVFEHDGGDEQLRTPSLWEDDDDSTTPEQASDDGTDGTQAAGETGTGA